MCGAFSIIHPFRDLSGRFNAGYNGVFEKPRYNVRPTQPVPVILNSDPSEIVPALWGIHPFYDKTKKTLLINARDDSLSKITWRRLLSSKRCLIVADGFYEWQKLEGQKNKVPYRFELKSGEPFAFAGLWQEEEDKGGIHPHCAIITTSPNKVVEDVHDRMPVILEKDLEKAWLDVDADTDQLLEYLKPYPATKMKKFAISTKVNSVSNDFPEIILPEKNSA